MARSALLNIMVQAATKAGRSLTRDFGEIENLQVSRKGPGDFVSNADKRSEEIIFEELQKARPTYSFLMEESGAVQGSDGQHRWIVDPLDGTTNFLHSIPLFSSAIALERNGEIVASVVYNPIMEELYMAERGTGAWLNNHRLRVAGRKRLADAALTTGHKITGTKDDARSMKQLASITPACAGIRQTGSASIDLAWLAAGRFDGYWQANLGPWNVAPGMMLVREAGGFVTDFTGASKSIETGEVVAGNEAIHASLLKAVRAAS